MRGLESVSVDLQEAVNQVMRQSVDAQKRLDHLFKALSDPTNGRVIHLPNGQTSTFKGPSVGDVCANHTDSLRNVLQCLRVVIALQTSSIQLLNHLAGNKQPAAPAEPAAAGNGNGDAPSPPTPAPETT